jgi:hypothetical protein
MYRGEHNVIKGYVKMYERKIPVTWERETNRYVFDVRKMTMREGKWIADHRLYDNKIAKLEIEMIG